MAREIGISKVKLIPLDNGTDLTTHTDVRYNYVEAIDVSYAVSLETEIENATGEYYGDNIIEHSVNQASKMNVTLEVSSQMPPADDAAIRGMANINGKTATGTESDAPYFALMYEILMDDGSVRRRVIYKTKFTRNTHTNATKEDSIEGQTYTYEGVAVPLVYNNAIDMVMDETEVAEYKQDAPSGNTATDVVVKEHFENFFTKVIMPEEERTTTNIA